MDIIVVRVLEDNFSYIIVDRASKRAAVVDAVEPDKVLAAAEAERVEIVAVLTTRTLLHACDRPALRVLCVSHEPIACLPWCYGIVLGHGSVGHMWRCF